MVTTLSCVDTQIMDETGTDTSESEIPTCRLMHMHFNKHNANNTFPAKKNALPKKNYP